MKKIIDLMETTNQPSNQSLKSILKKNKHQKIYHKKKPKPKQILKQIRSRSKVVIKNQH